MLFQAFTSPALQLKNRVVMAPLTRSRAVEANTPNELMLQYYAQRAGAGLIVTEGTAPSPNGLGYARIPGLFNAAHVAGWRRVTDAVHAQGAKIFVQLMHTGRVAHAANLPAGARVLGPTAQPLAGEIYTDALGMQPYATPQAMSADDIRQATEEFVHGARLAVEAGFDGVELHAANGYLLEQFLNANVNTRDDGYGGSAEKRNRFVLEVARATVAAIGAQRVGIRVSPHGAFNGTGSFDGVEPQYLALARELGALKLAYLHLVDHAAMGAPAVPAAFKAQLRAAFGGTFIASGGLDKGSAEQVLQQGRGDLVAFGRAWLANPDLIERMKAGLPLNAPDPSTFYTPGAKGYTDYPRAQQAAVAA
ncbi:MAG TPA: alkene reductase [Rubrivivax sp.]|nr:alkene reductase [Rubrivivax sp.]